MDTNRTGLALEVQGRVKELSRIPYDNRSPSQSAPGRVDKLMLKGQWSSSKVLRLSEDPIPDVTGCSRQRKVLSSLRLKYPKGSMNDGHWEMTLDDAERNATLTLGATKLQSLREGIDDISRGKGDYAIGPDGGRYSQQCLWFWW